MKNKMPLITANEAFDKVMSEISLCQEEFVSLEKCRGRFLREAIQAERCAPPFDRVMMDGIAIRKADYLSGKKTFPLKGMAQAGHPTTTLEKGHAIEVCTGAPLPEGADQVVPYEMITITAQEVTINEFPLEAFVHFKGSDFLEGEILLEQGAKLNSPRIGLCASQGKENLRVSICPKIAIVSTGDELIAPGKSLLEHQIRLSNPFAFSSELEAWGFNDNHFFHFKDDKDFITTSVQNLLAQYQFIIFSGAISKGAFDFLPQAFEANGVKTLFHGVKQKPGKPLFFGRGPEKQYLFALPGNPISSLINLRRYVIPALLKNVACTQRDHLYVHTKAPIKGSDDFTFFVPVKVVEQEGKLWATPLSMKNSGDYNSLTDSHGFVLTKKKQSDGLLAFYPWGDWNYYGPEF